jgi:hypothetical protein
MNMQNDESKCLSSLEPLDLNDVSEGCISADDDSPMANTPKSKEIHKNYEVMSL